MEVGGEPGSAVLEGAEKGCQQGGRIKEPGEGKPEKGPSPLGWDH